MSKAIPHYVKMREKHRSEGGDCRACRPRVRYPCEVMRLVLDLERASEMVRVARKILQEIGTLSIGRLDKRGE